MDFVAVHPPLPAGLDFGIDALRFASVLPLWSAPLRQQIGFVAALQVAVVVLPERLRTGAVMAVKIPDPLERFRPAGLHGFIFRYQKSPLLKVIPFNCPVVAIVAHRILLSGDLISEFVNLHSNDVERAGILKASARRGRPA